MSDDSIHVWRIETPDGYAHQGGGWPRIAVRNKSVGKVYGSRSSAARVRNSLKRYRYWHPGQQRHEECSSLRVVEYVLDCVGHS